MTRVLIAEITRLIYFLQFCVERGIGAGGLVGHATWARSRVQLVRPHGRVGLHAWVGPHVHQPHYGNIHGFMYMATCIYGLHAFEAQIEFDETYNGSHMCTRRHIHIVQIIHKLPKVLVCSNAHDKGVPLGRLGRDGKALAAVSGPGIVSGAAD